MAIFFDFHADRIDVSDLTDRFEELRDERAGLVEAIDDAQHEYLTAETDSEIESAQTAQTDAAAALEAFDEADGDELTTLSAVLDDLKGYGGDHQWEGDWFPNALIADSDFEDHARELAEDVGAIPDDSKWPCTCIDWAKAARELQMDYTAVTIDGRDYWYR